MADDFREPVIGESVIYTDPVGTPIPALVTAWWGQPSRLVNIVYVSTDENRTDSYGRQIERSTSLMHVSKSNVHGNYWRYPEEAPNEIVAPQAR